jgi:putative ABC transport system substrate-binding protein
MSNKVFCLALCAVLFALSIPVKAQQTNKVPRIGYLSAARRSALAARTEAFRQGLRELGYVEGKDIVIEYRFAEGKLDRLSELAAELVRLKVDVIVATGRTPSLAAKQVTTTIPIVMTVSGDPVGAGLVASLARPGGSITGLTSGTPDLDGKRLELLKETLPKVKRVAFIHKEVSGRAFAGGVKEIQATARELGITLQSIEARNAKEVEAALQAVIKERAGALWVASPVVSRYRKQIVDFAGKRRLPLIYATRGFVEKAGGLMSYGPDYSDLWRRAATYVDKILKGAKPADLPVERPMKFELVFNLRAAKQIGVTIPQEMLFRADKVIK